MNEVKVEIAKIEDVSKIAELAYQTSKTHEAAYLIILSQVMWKAMLLLLKRQ